MKKKEPSPTTSNPSLSNDLLLSCLARVSKLYYPTLSLVSKSFRSLFASPELYKARSLLGQTEGCLYVCMSDGNSKWFTLCRKPDTTLTNNKKKSGGYVLAKVPIPHSPPVKDSSLVAVGSSIYIIGGSTSSTRVSVGSSIYTIFGSTSTRVSVLDCTSHTWSEAPSFNAKLKLLTASVVDRKIYVAGFCKSSIIIEVLDTKSKVWDPVPTSWSDRSLFLGYQSICIDGKFHLKTDTQTVAYNSKEGRWDLVGRAMFQDMRADSYCVIENVLYSVYSDKVFKWYDSEVSKWRKLEGLVGLPKFPLFARLRLASYGGNMAVLWDESLPYNGKFTKKEIWCLEIALERRENREIWGKVEWFDVLLTVPEAYDVMKVLAVTV